MHPISHIVIYGLFIVLAFGIFFAFILSDIMSIAISRDG